MKKIALFIFMGLLVGNLFAQEPGATEKNAGNAAWKAKNYADAFKNFEAYLKIVNYKDNAYIYNAAVAASKLKKNAEAEKYFDMSVKNKYKTASSYLGKAQAQKALNKTPEMLVTLQEAMKATPGNMKIETMYATHFLREGQKFQKDGNEAKAAEAYNKLTSLVTKSFKAQGLISLAGLYFNNGAKLLQDVTPLANTDKAKYEAGKTKATEDFKKAKDYLLQAKTIDPTNADIADLMKQIDAALK